MTLSTCQYTSFIRANAPWCSPGAREEEPEPEPEPAPPPPESDDEEPVPQQQQPRRKRKLVTKTFVDDEGFMGQYRVWGQNGVVMGLWGHGSLWEVAGQYGVTGSRVSMVLLFSGVTGQYRDTDQCRARGGGRVSDSWTCDKCDL